MRRVLFERAMGVAVLVSVFAIPWSIGCSRVPHGDGSRRTVIEIGSKKVTVADLEAYLEENLMSEKADEPAPPEEENKVKSRLFDDFVDEQLLLAEAEKRGVVVRDDEVAAYLGSETGELPAELAPDETRRRTAHRELMIQKLREDQAASDRLLSELRRRSDVHLRLENLPFPYVPDQTR